MAAILCRTQYVQHLLQSRHSGRGLGTSHNTIIIHVMAVLCLTYPDNHVARLLGCLHMLHRMKIMFQMHFTITILWPITWIWIMVNASWNAAFAIFHFHVIGYRSRRRGHGEQIMKNIMYEGRSRCSYWYECSYIFFAHLIIQISHECLSKGQAWLIWNKQSIYPHTVR